MLSSYSQISSPIKQKDTMVLVPVSALRNALLVLDEKKYCQQQLEVARDTIKSQQEMLNNSDTIINRQKKAIELHEQNKVEYKKIITNHEKEIIKYQDLYKKEKRNKWFAICGGSFFFIISIIFL